MIDTDRMRMAYAATPLCQREWTKKEGNNPTMLCAVSALVSFAGVQPDLIHKMNDELPAHSWVTCFAWPILAAEYGIPHDIAGKFPELFDKQENEWRGVQAVLDLCERRNMQELHRDAIREDAERFPQHTCEQRFTMSAFTLTLTHDDIKYIKAMWLGVDQAYNVAPNPMPVTHLAEKPKGQTEKGKSTFWTAKKPKWLTAGV